MKPSPLKICKECRPSLHKQLKNAKNAILENEANAPVNATSTQMAVLRDYVHKNIIKKPEHYGYVAKMAIDTRSDWQSGRMLTVGFMGGNRIVRERLIRHAKTWMEYANIEFDFKPKRSTVADIRISFDKSDGSWSYIGTDILTVPPNAATMNYGWLTPTTADDEYHRVVLHEFGHTLGCIHEHANPIGGVPWNKKAAYEFYMKEQGWTKEEVDDQLFEKYSRDIIRGTKIDKKSIMMYPIPKEITDGKFEVGWNDGLSATDKKFIAKVYPKK